jgi:alkylhydroperoxidase family enzyme
MDSHGAVASIELSETLTESVLRDWQTAPIPERLRAMLGFLEKMTLRPEELTEKDGATLRDAGISEAAATEAIYVSTAFNHIVRLADTFGFDLLTPEGYAKAAKHLYKRGYLL